MAGSSATSHSTMKSATATMRPQRPSPSRRARSSDTIEMAYHDGGISHGTWPAILAPRKSP